MRIKIFFQRAFISLSLVVRALASDCASEIPKRDFDEEYYATPEGHEGPVTIMSLNLTTVFDCLRNMTALDEPIGYRPGIAGIQVNVSLDDIDHISDAIYSTCFSDNEFGFTQLDYLTFTNGLTYPFTDISKSSNDNTIVRSNIMGWPNNFVHGELRSLNNETDAISY